jgi:hypothetical protein
MAQRVKKGIRGTTESWLRWVIARRPVEVRDLIERYFMPLTLNNDAGGLFVLQPVVRRTRNTIRITQRGGLDV